MREPKQDADFPARPVIAIIGTGAIGSYYGGRLAQHGHDIHFLLRADYEAVRTNGLVVKSCGGDFAIPSSRINAHRDPAQMPKADLVIVTLKSTANDQFKPLISPLLHDATAILTLQNGLGNEEQLASLFGARRVLAGVAFICANRLEPGLIDHTAHGRIKLGEFIADPAHPPAAPTARSTRLAELFSSSGVPCEAVVDVRCARWEKLVWNIPFNGLSALLDQTTDQLLARTEGMELVKELMAEVIAAARACGVPLPDGLIEKQIKSTLEMGAYRTSSHVDRNAGRPLEIEAIWGWPLRYARQHRVLTVKTAMLYQLLTLGEQPSPK